MQQLIVINFSLIIKKIVKFTMNFILFLIKFKIYCQIRQKYNKIQSIYYFIYFHCKIKSPITLYCRNIFWHHNKKSKNEIISLFLWKFIVIIIIKTVIILFKNHNILEK